MAQLFNPAGWVNGVTIPDVIDYQNIASDLATRGITIDGGLYGRANSAYLTLVPKALPGTTYTVTAGSWVGGVATLTLGTHHLIVNQHVQIASVTPTGYNSADAVVTGITTTQISYAVSVNPGTWVSGGTVTADLVSTPAIGTLAANPTGGLVIWSGSSWNSVGAVTVVPSLEITTSGLLVDLGGITVTAGLTSLGAGLTVTSGNVVVSTGNLTVSAGSLTVSAGNLVVTAGTLTGKGLAISTGGSGILLNPAAAGASQSSQVLTFTGTNVSSAAKSATLNADLNGNLVFTTPTGTGLQVNGTLVMTGPSGTAGFVYQASSSPAFEVADNSSTGVCVIAVSTSGGGFQSGTSAGDAVIYQSNASLGLGLASGGTVRLYLRHTGVVYVNAPTFSSDSAAGSGGLVTGDIWVDSSGNMHRKL